MPVSSHSNAISRNAWINLAARLRKLNEESETTGAHAHRRDRSCGVCRAADPEQRLWAKKCCHAVCSACADGKTTCPLCEAPTSFKKLFEENSCQICACEAPVDMSVFSRCGHTVCGACGVQLIVDSKDRGELRTSCPFCRTSSGLCPIKTRHEKKNN